MSTTTNNTPPGSRSDQWIAILIALSLLSLLIPLPKRAVSMVPWAGEMVTTLALTAAFGVLYFRDRNFLSRLFSAGDAWAAWIVRLFALFALWSAVSGLWAPSPHASVHHALLWGEYLLFFLFAREQMSSGRGFAFLTTIFAAVAGILGVLCLIEYVTLPDFSALEAVIRGRYGAYSELLVTILPVLWIGSAFARKRSKYILINAAAVLGWMTVMLSLSKGAFLAGIIGLLVAFAGAILLSGTRFRRRIAISAAVWLIVTIGMQVGQSLLSPVPATVDYLSGNAGEIRNSSMQRVFIWQVGRQMAADHLLLGVGADNFGLAFNGARSAYVVHHPSDLSYEPVSDTLAARLHNEPLQVAAELGIAGLLLFIAPFAAIAFICINRIRNSKARTSPILWAAIGGMAAFAASSMVSSFSFRIVQNGIAFFLVAAVAVYEARKTRGPQTITRQRLIVAVAVTAFLLLSLGLHMIKGVAEYYVYAADRTTDTPQALELYTRAATLDPAFAAAWLHRSGRSYSENDFASAAIDLRKAIDHGSGVVITYSALAKCYEHTGDMAAAESAFREAFTIFPRSVFLRVRYAVFLETAGRGSEANEQMTLARSIDERQANGWHNLMTIGSTRSFFAAREMPQLLAAPAELQPEPAVLEYLDKFPADQ